MVNLTDLLNEAKRIAINNGLVQYIGSRLIIAIPSRGAYAGIVQGIRPERQFNTVDASGNVISELPPTGSEYYMPDGSILINIAKAMAPNGDFWFVGYSDSYQIYTTSNLTILKVGTVAWYNELVKQGFNKTVLGIDPNREQTVISPTILVETYPKIPEGYTGSLRETQVFVGGNVQTVTVPVDTQTQSVVINGTRIDVPQEQAQEIVDKGIGIAPIDTTITKIGETIRVSKNDPTYIIETDIIPSDIWVFAGDKWNHVVNGKVIASQNNAPESVARSLYPSTPSTIFDSGIQKQIVEIPKQEINVNMPISIDTLKNVESVKSLWDSLLRSDYYNIPNWLWLGLIILVVILIVGVTKIK